MAMDQMYTDTLRELAAVQEERDRLADHLARYNAWIAKGAARPRDPWMDAGRRIWAECPVLNSEEK